MKEKPYGCTEENCTKCYRAKRSLDKHMANVHPEPGQDIPRKNCNVPGCGATFVWADSLRLHTKNKHPGTKHLMLLIKISEAFSISIIADIASDYTIRSILDIAVIHPTIVSDALQSYG